MNEMFIDDLKLIEVDNGIEISFKPATSKFGIGV